MNIPAWLGSQGPIVHLRRRIDAGTVVPFVGAGLSKEFGFPSWQALVDRLRARARAAVNTSLARQEAPRDPLLAVEYLRMVLGEDAYLDELRATFALDAAKRAAIDASPLSHALRDLRCMVWLTTNYDLALEHGLRSGRAGVDSHSWSEEREVNRFIAGRSRRAKRPAVLHLHGKLDVPRDIVLTERDYQQRYWWVAGDRFRLATLFSTRSMLFLGTSLTDEDLKTVLREVRARVRQRWGQHFWVRGVDAATAPAADRDRRDDAVYWREKFGVELIEYPCDGHDHGALVDVLRALGASAPPPEVSAEAAARPEDDPNKGQFGGASEVDGYRLRARFRVYDDAKAWVRVALTVEAPAGEPAPQSVTWFLHPTFEDAVQKSAFRGRRASLSVIAWGAFTVGARVLRPGAAPVALELDLASLPTAPAGFRDR